MKHLLYSFLVLISFIFVSNTASAKGIPIPVFYGDGPKFVTTQQLPDSVTIEGKHVNFGVGFNQFSVFWVPMWNWGTTEYVLTTNDEKLAYTLDEDDLVYLKEEYNIDTDKTPSIPFWHKTGGKIIWGAVLSFIVWGVLPGKKNKDKENEQA